MNERERKELVTLLTDADPAARRRSAEALAESRGFAAIAALAAALQDEHKGVRDAASRALLSRGGENVARAVVEYLGDPNIVTRNLASDILVQLGTLAIPALFPATADPDQDVRKFAVDILGSISSPDALACLVDLLDDSDANVSVSAVEALGNIRNEGAVGAIIAIYGRREDARAAAVEALGKIGGKAAAEFLETEFIRLIASTTVDPVVMYTFLEALGKVGSQRAVELLQKQIKLVKGKLRNILVHSMVQLADRVGLRLSDLDLSVDVLTAALADDDIAIRISAAQGLCARGKGSELYVLIRALGASEALDAVLLKCLSGRAELFLPVVEMLERGEIRPGKQTFTLLNQSALSVDYEILPAEFLNEKINLLSRAYRLVRAAWPKANEETRSIIVDLLFRFDGDQAVESLHEIMNDPDPWLRMHTIELLAPLDDRRIPDFIARFLDDEDPMVREVAVSILQSKGHQGVSAGKE